MFLRFTQKLLFPLLIVGVFLTLLIIQSCSTPNNENDNTLIIYPPGTKNQVTITQGVWGDVWFWEGDFTPGSIKGNIIPVQREIYIYEATPRDSAVRVGFGSFYNEIKTNLIGIVSSNRTGFFEVTLDTGVYSFFVKEGSLFYASRDNGVYIQPARVFQDSMAHVQIDITYKATF